MAALDHYFVGYFGRRNVSNVHGASAVGVEISKRARTGGRSGASFDADDLKAVLGGRAQGRNSRNAQSDDCYVHLDGLTDLALFDGGKLSVFPGIDVSGRAEFFFGGGGGASGKRNARCSHSSENCAREKRSS